MDTFQKHEQFEMEVLNFLNSERILPGLIFGGGTMLRLCHGLDRYSVDLDFYLFNDKAAPDIYQKIISSCARRYTLSDQADKHNSLLIELQATNFPRKLKIEINKFRKIENWKKEIAWSPHSTIQVLTATVALPLMAMMKVEALLNRKEIRDAYDLEFLIRKGTILTNEKQSLQEVLKVINGFRKVDYTSKLGSILEPEKRKYYTENKFRFLHDAIITGL